MARRRVRDLAQDQLYQLIVKMLEKLPGAARLDGPADENGKPTLRLLNPPTAVAAPDAVTPGSPVAPVTPTAAPPIDGTPPPPNLADDPEDPTDDPEEVARLPFDVAREAITLHRAIRMACDTRGRVKRLTEMMDGTSINRTIGSGSDQFRRNHTVMLAELTLSDYEIAFGDPNDNYREAFAAYCYTMYKGYGQRFLDRHEAEADEEYIDRPGRLSTNLTKLVIKILSKLYAKPPTRKPKEGTPEHVKAALTEMWSDPLFNQTLAEADKMVRLLGVVAIRPFFEPDRPGKILIWPFLSHQIRVLPDAGAPWKPAAVIERVQPFQQDENTRVLWTDKFYVQWCGGAPIAEGDFERFERHGLGRVPHTIVKDEPSYTSFFVDGIGRTLCPRHASINERLTNLHEIEALQGFAVAECINPESSKPRMGPRTAVVFRPKADSAGQVKPFGINFKNPGAPIVALRESLEADIRDVLRDHGIPEAALGAAIQQRQLSGAAIRATMQPLQEDRDQRSRVWSERETDLADSCLRIRREYDGAFSYTPAAERPQFTTHYSKPDTPMDTGEKVKRDEFDIATGKKSPPDLMMEDEPERYEDRDKAKTKWLENLAEQREAGMAGAETDPNLAPFGADAPGDSSSTPLVDAFLNGMDQSEEERQMRTIGRKTLDAASGPSGTKNGAPV